MPIEIELPLADHRIGVVGRLASMSRADAARVCKRAGGVLVHPPDSSVTLLVIGEGSEADVEITDAALATQIEQGECVTIDEAEFWNRVGLVAGDADTSSLYSPAMLAELVGAPLIAVRRWIRKGYLQPASEVRRLAYFDFPEVTIARLLANLHLHGVSLAAIDSKLADLERQLPGVARPLAELTVVVDGGRLYLRRDGDTVEPTGQRMLPFDTSTVTTDPASLTDEAVTLALAHPSQPVGRASRDADDDLREMALELADAGELAKAIDAYRAICLAGAAGAEDYFLLAELLYQVGEPHAARERYYMTIECDDSFVEARANLGCLLAELGEIDLAVAALAGALDQHPDFADAHYHLARLHTAQGNKAAAEPHWRQFLALAPDSPWAEEAREHVEV